MKGRHGLLGRLVGDEAGPFVETAEVDCSAIWRSHSACAGRSRARFGMDPASALAQFGFDRLELPARFGPTPLAGEFTVA